MSTGSHSTGSRDGASRDRQRRRASRLEDDNRRLRRSEHRLTTAMAGGRICWWTYYVEDDRLEMSEPCRALFGLTDSDAVTLDAILGALVREDRPHRDAAFQASLTDGVDYDLEYRVRWPDGQQRTLQIRGRPIRANDGAVIGLSGVALDVSTARDAQTREELLREELQHRLKNTLATVQALASQTLRTADSFDAFRANFGARLEALGRSMASGDAGTAEPDTLRGVLFRALEPYIEAASDRFVFDGPDVPLHDRPVTALSLVAHELATNAMKYGALSNDAGRVEVTWTVQDGRVALLWRERGGPVVAAPTRRGFGSRLIERAAPLELKGEATLTYEPEGVIFALDFPA